MQPYTEKSVDYAPSPGACGARRLHVYSTDPRRPQDDLLAGIGEFTAGAIVIVVGDRQKKKLFRPPVAPQSDFDH